MLSCCVIRACAPVQSSILHTPSIDPLSGQGCKVQVQGCRPPTSDGQAQMQSVKHFYKIGLAVTLT